MSRFHKIHLPKMGNNAMNQANETILRAVIEKAKTLGDDAPALIGIYGSAATGDTHGKSDLDLLIPACGESARRLAAAFILDDPGVGYDIYCADPSSLLADAQCRHAHLSRLLDAKIVFIRDEEAFRRFCELQEQARRILASSERFDRVYELEEKAKAAFADACLCEGLGQVRLHVFGVMHCLMDAAMLFHGTYFRLGTKQALEELSALPVDPAFPAMLQAAAAAKTAGELRGIARDLLLYARAHFHAPKEKAAPSCSLAGTYEEMYSNWRNKVEEAAKNGDIFSSFVNMCSMQYMLNAICSETGIGTDSLLEAYDPARLEHNTLLLDACLQKYESVYRAAGISINRFADAEAFAADYLRK